MKVDKKLKFEELAEVLKVIGHPVRLKIICGLISQQACVTDIYKCLGMPQATVSQHLSLLKNKRIVKSKRDGVKMRYQVINKDVENIVNMLMREK